METYLVGGAVRDDVPGPHRRLARRAGSLIVAEFESLEDARAWADADPYVIAGVYESVEVTPFIRVLP